MHELNYKSDTCELKNRVPFGTEKRSAQINNAHPPETVASVVHDTQRWIDAVVVNLNLCPFAKRELDRGSVRFVVCEGDEEALLHSLQAELELLESDAEIETTLIIHPNALTDFPEYNDFLSLAEGLLRELGFDGVVQIASFHPDYQFAETSFNDAENYSNRSPYPMLHLLRESSVSRAVESHPNIDAVPENNIATLQALGSPALQELLKGISGGN